MENCWSGRYKGFYAENFVAQEFTASEGRGTGNRELFSWAGKNSEIEFLKVIDNRVVPVEVKSGQRTKAKSLLVYRNKYSPPLQVKITANNLQRGNKPIHNYPLYLAGKIT